MKKIILIIFLLYMMGMSARAEEIVVQGESFNKADVHEEVKILPGDSTNPVMVVSQWKNPDKSYYIEYEVVAPSAGGYELSAVVSEIDSPYTSNFSYSVNGGKQIYSGDVFKKVSKPGTSYSSDSMYLYTLGVAELNSGTNTIRFIVDEVRETSTNWVLFLMDYFTLTKKEFGLYSMIPAEPNSVFELGDEVEFELRFTDYPNENKIYTVVVEDYFHDRVAGRKFEISSTSISQEINFGTLPVGWYRILIYDGENKVYESGFSVTHKVDERKSNTHFAVDFAGFSLASGKTEVKNLSRAARLAGINTVRERYHWTSSDTVNKYQTETIEAEGLDVINMFHDAPTELVSGGYMPDDLFEVYNFQKSYAQKYSDAVDYMEIWNEEDTAFATETADRYSSFLKAAAIGISDGSDKVGKVHGGFANSPADTQYMDICMMNDFMEYSDMYNYHAYASGGKSYDTAPSLSKEELSENRDILTAYGYNNRKTWVTEGGIAVLNDVELSRRQQARASVINNVQSIVNGNDKHFLFVLPKYYESGNEYGIFCEDKSPSPAYTALENFTYHIGEGEYKGVFRDLSENTFGYLFNNGENDVGIFWTESKESFIQLKSDKPVMLVDLMGKETIVQPVNGIVSIKVSMNPVYLKFSDDVERENYVEYKKQSVNFQNAIISDNKRIVIQQSFEKRSHADEKNKGYLIYKNDDNLCSLKIYNFSNKTQTGVINARISEGFTLDRYSQEITVPAMSSIDLSFKVRVSDGVIGNAKGFLQFGGVMNGEEITRSTSLVRCRKFDSIPLAGSFENSKYANKWHVSGSVSSGRVVASNTGNEGEVRFDVNLDGNGWSYPNFDVTDASVLEGSAGIKISVGATKDVSQAILYCFAYMKDGRKYFQGSLNGKTIKAGYTDYYFPWDEMVIQYLPEGVSPDAEFLLKDIKHIAVGINLSGTTTATYFLKDIGWYKGNGENDITEWEDVELVNAEKSAVYYKGMAPVVEAQLPTDDIISAINVYLSGEEYSGYIKEENIITVDLNDMDVGVYTLLITAENNFGYIYRDSIDFIIQ